MMGGLKEPEAGGRRCRGLVEEPREAGRLAVECRLGQLGGRGGTLRPSVRRALWRGPRQYCSVLTTQHNNNINRCVANLAQV